MADKIADIEVANVNEDAEEVKAIMKNKPVYKIGEKKNKISPVVPDATTTPPPQRECVEEQQSIDTILKAKQEDAANLRRKRTTIIQDRIRQSYIIQGKDPEAVSQEQIEEDAGNAFHSMWSGLGSLSKSGKVLVQGALEKVENVTSKVEGKMKEVHVYPSEVLERVTSGFPKKKYAALHGSLLPVADQLYHINKKIKEEGMKLEIVVPSSERPFDHAAIELDNQRLWIDTPKLERRDGRLMITAQIMTPTGQPMAIGRDGVTTTLFAPNGAFEYRGCLGA